jgi:hypothetical protein
LYDACIFVAISSHRNLFIYQLDLPQYATQDELRGKLLTAIKEGSEGFGFA